MRTRSPLPLTSKFLNKQFALYKFKASSMTSSALASPFDWLVSTLFEQTLQGCRAFCKRLERQKSEISDCAIFSVVELRMIGLCSVSHRPN